jgi:hypothetical protein
MERRSRVPTDVQKPQSIDYAVEISGVREVSLIGTAELGFWRDRLLSEGFFPVPAKGRAELLVSSTNARFHGIPFRELSFGVFVSRREDSTEAEGLYLVRAFNSVRFFAFAERTFFSTPYYPGELVVEVGPPARVELRERGRVPLRMTMSMSMSPRMSADVRDDGWEGPIFLPRNGRGGGKLFFARLRGETTVSPFDPVTDVVTIAESPAHPIFDELLRSGFTPREWVVRPNATHGKSKTVPLDSVPRLRTSSA